MNRRQLLLGAGAMAGAVVDALGAQPESLAAQRVLTASDVHVDKYPTVEAVRWMGRTIEERTSGRLRIRVYHSGQLGRESDAIELARAGALDITRVNFAALNNAFPLSGAFVLPYVFDSVAHMRRVVDGKAGSMVRAAFASRGLVGLAIYDAGARSFYNVKRPVHVPADLHGLKIRVPPSDIFLKMVSALGANPTPLPVNETYSALQTHLIDGGENNWRTFHSSRQFEVARYWSQTGHSYSPEALLMSRRSFDALAPGDREIVLAAAAESVPYMRGLWDRMEQESRLAVLKAGVRFNEVDRPAFLRAVRSVHAQYLDAGPLRDLYTLIQAAA
jgi:tripartite ATP-independent transporter DctP family solute receptor